MSSVPRAPLALLPAFALLCACDGEELAKGLDDGGVGVDEGGGDGTDGADGATDGGDGGDGGDGADGGVGVDEGGGDGTDGGADGGGADGGGADGGGGGATRLEGFLSLYYGFSEDGGVDCQTDWEIDRATPTSSCPDCDWAFEDVQYGLSSDGCGVDDDISFDGIGLTEYRGDSYIAVLYGSEWYPYTYAYPSSGAYVFFLAYYYNYPYEYRGNDYLFTYIIYGAVEAD